MTKMRSQRSLGETTKGKPVTRASNVPGSDVGKKRYDLYSNAYRKIAESKATAFYIECVAILESIIADRLESRRACLHPTVPDKHRFETLRTASRLICEETSTDQEIKRIYHDITDWKTERNEAVHQIVKLGDEHSTTSWNGRYAELRETVDRGEKLARAISRKVKALNKRDYANIGTKTDRHGDPRTSNRGN